MPDIVNGEGKGYLDCITDLYNGDKNQEWISAGHPNNNSTTRIVLSEECESHLYSLAYRPMLELPFITRGWWSIPIDCRPIPGHLRLNLGKEDNNKFSLCKKFTCFYGEFSTSEMALYWPAADSRT
jgi:hypothetical protein